MFAAVTASGQWANCTTAPAGSECISGSLGIGTTTPSVQLHTYAASGQIVAGVQSGANQWSALYSTSGGNGALFWDGSSAMRFGTSNALNPSSFTELMRIAPSGNVGIGTSVPGTLLDVNKSTTGGTILRVFNPTAGTGNYAQLQIKSDDHTTFFHGLSSTWTTSGADVQSGSSLASDGSGGLSIVAAHGSGVIRFYTSSNSAERMRISNSGNVGIGSTVPTRLLEVQGSAVINGSFSRETLVLTDTTPAAAGVGGGIVFAGKYNAGVGPGGQVINPFAAQFASINGIKENGVDGDFATAMTFYTRANLANPLERLRIDSAGNVGIGLGGAAATQRLDVNGNINVSGNINAKYQDVAEWVPVVEEMPAGTVVVVSGTTKNTVGPSLRAYDTRVAGVVSAAPGLILGEASSSKAKIATTGRVNVRVDATKHPIAMGDLLVTSDKPGLAMFSEPLDLGGIKIHRPGTLIGKALEPLPGGEGEILVLLSLQ
jgi:hypothetical protein